MGVINMIFSVICVFLALMSYSKLTPDESLVQNKMYFLILASILFSLWAISHKIDYLIKEIRKK